MRFNDDNGRAGNIEPAGTGAQAQKSSASRAVAGQHPVQAVGDAAGDEHSVGRRRRRHRLPVGTQFAARVGVRRVDRDSAIANPPAAGSAHGFAELLVVFTRGSTAIEAIQALPPPSISSTTPPSLRRNSSRSLTTTPTSSARPRTAQTGNDVDIDALLPTTNAQKYLQANYTTPFTDFDQALSFDDAHDGSAWSAASAKFNDFFREIVKRFEFEDALLLDTRGNVVYSAYKGVDLGTNILTGPYKGGDLTDAYNEGPGLPRRRLRRRHRLRRLPAGRRTDGLDGVPGRPQGRVEGVLALQFPISKINRLMTMDKRWEESGMGKTGETFIVGPDDLMRSDSRLFLEDPEAFKRDVVNAGTRPMWPTNRSGSTARRWCSRLPPKPPSARSEARSGTLVADDYLGHDVAGLRTGRRQVCTGRSSPRSTPPKPSLRYRRSPAPWCCPRWSSFSSSVWPRCCSHALRAADPAAGSGAQRIRRRLRRRGSGAIARRIRRSHHGFQRHEPKSGDQGRAAHRTA